MTVFPFSNFRVTEVPALEAMTALKDFPSVVLKRRKAAALSSALAPEAKLNSNTAQSAEAKFRKDFMEGRDVVLSGVIAARHGGAQGWTLAPLTAPRLGAFPRKK